MIHNRRGERVDLPKRSFFQGPRSDEADTMSGDRRRVSQGAEGAVTVFAPLTHPVLKAVDPVSVSTFLRERERYERQVDEKQSELPTLKAASYAVSVDAGLLKTLVFLGEFDNIAPNVPAEELQSDHIKKYVESLVSATTSGFDPKVVENALKGLRVTMSIAEPKSRMLQYVNDFFQRLEVVGYGEFRTKNPKNTVELLNRSLY